MIGLDTLNASSAAGFTAALDGVFEHAPWVAERTAGKRPFADLAAMHAALMETVGTAPDAELLAFLRAHPELAASKLPTGLTDASLAEQTGLSMNAAPGAAELPRLNRAYLDRFGFPFIVCVARHTPENVLRSLAARLAADPAHERATALAEIHHITRLRLAARIAGGENLARPGHLSTHVLDTALGRPVEGLEVTLRQEGRPLATVTTDRDGRTPALLPHGPLRQGSYSLTFAAGAYYAARHQPTLYADIPIPFLITESEGRYHIPLLLAPFGYSTYRGS